jgi:magnesium-protoporphyrin O-methyltransferase
LAFKGAAITATDISAAMAEEAARRYEAEAGAPGAPARPATPPTFAAASLDELTGGPWDVVTCIDVLIHYPQAKVDAMLASLVGKASKKVVLSFAPSTPYYEVWREQKKEEMGMFLGVPFCFARSLSHTPPPLLPPSFSHRS